MAQGNIRIGDRTVGGGHPVFIIAEAGINHNGDMALAKRLVDLAAEAGADAIKFQSFVSEEVVTKKMQKVEYQKDGDSDTESFYDMIKRWEFDALQTKELLEYCNRKGIICFSTPSDEVSARMLHTLGVPVFKIGSNDLVTLPMLEEIASWGKPMILSTGMADLEEVREALDTLESSGNTEVAVLQCTSSYPASLDVLNLSVVRTLQDAFRVPIGFSDHSIGIEAAPLAVLLGAVIVEKHITVDRTLPGPDQSMALDLPDFTSFVRIIREVEGLGEEERAARIASYPDRDTLLGSAEKKPTPAELEMRKAIRKGIVARRTIAPGEILTKDMLAFKQPCEGIPARLYKTVLGKVATTNMAPDEFITLQHLA